LFHRFLFKIDTRGKGQKTFSAELNLFVTARITGNDIDWLFILQQLPDFSRIA